jgi:Cu+-exporting ATPase
MDEKTSKANFSLSGLSCESCVRSIENTLKKLSGINPTTITVNLLTSDAIFEFDENIINPEQIKQAIIDSGFNVEDIKIEKKYNEPLTNNKKYDIELNISSQEGETSNKKSMEKMDKKISKANFSLTCESYVRSIESILKNLSGLNPATINVNLLISNAIFEFDENIINPEQIKQTMIDSGFNVEDIKIEKKYNEPPKPQKALTNNKEYDIELNISSQEGETSNKKCMEKMDEKISKANFSLSGLTCASCVRSIENTLKNLSGINPDTITVNLLMSNAIFEFDENIIKPEQIKQAIIDSGFNVEDIKIEKKYNEPLTINKEYHDTITKLAVSGMTCASCISTVQYSLESSPGVEYAHVNLLTGEANIKHDLNKIGPRDLIKIVEESGFGAELIKRDTSNNNGNAIRRRAEQHQKLLRNRFLISFLFSIPTALISMIFMMVYHNPVITYQIIPGLEVGTVILFVLATPVQFLLGYPFYIKGIRSVWYSRQANMDTLVAIGTTVAYFGSILNVLIPVLRKSDQPGYQFFETSVFLITFIWLGRWMEAKVKGKTFETITKLMELQPEKSILITLNYDENKQENVEEKEIDMDLVQGKLSKETFFIYIYILILIFFFLLYLFFKNIK